MSVSGLGRRERLRRRRRDYGCSYRVFFSGMPSETVVDSPKEYYPHTNPALRDETTKDINKYLFAREQGLPLRYNFHELGTRHMIENKIFQEHLLPLKTNKVFCSKWLSDSNIAMGTKCNKLLVHNVQSHKLFEIPTLKSSSASEPLEQESGIHSISINPSNSFLVSGGPRSNDVSVYNLPSLKPVCVGEKAHKDWIFDLQWIDDQWFVSGSRDGNIALWKVNPDEVSQSNDLNYYYIRPVMVKPCYLADKVRAMHFQPLSKLTALSTNSFLHCWDLNKFEHVSSRKLPYGNENICLAYNSRDIYAVGSSSHITFFDTSSLAVIKSIKTPGRSVSVRSLSFRGDLMTIGTGYGMLQFYDLAAGKFLNGLEIKISSLDLHDEIRNDLVCTCSALYTHCYDSSGTRLFVGGGPLSLLDDGCYAAIWQ